MTAELATLLAALITAFTSMVIWAVDRFGLLAPLIDRTRFNLSGRWVGWSVFLPTSLSPILNNEHFFRIKVTLKQRGKRIQMEELIEDIYDDVGNKIVLSSSRQFSGTGRLVGDVNVLLTMFEKDGLTCGTAYLVLDTWGRELKGLLAVRNIDGRPVAVSMELVREGQKDQSITDLVKRYNAQSQP